MDRQQDNEKEDVGKAVGVISVSRFTLADAVDMDRLVRLSCLALIGKALDGGLERTPEGLTLALRPYVKDGTAPCVECVRVGQDGKTVLRIDGTDYSADTLPTDDLLAIAQSLGPDAERTSALPSKTLLAMETPRGRQYVVVDTEQRSRLHYGPASLNMCVRYLREHKYGKYVLSGDGQESVQVTDGARCLKPKCRTLFPQLTARAAGLLQKGVFRPVTFADEIESGGVTCRVTTTVDVTRSHNGNVIFKAGVLNWKDGKCSCYTVNMTRRGRIACVQPLWQGETAARIMERLEDALCREQESGDRQAIDLI